MGMLIPMMMTMLLNLIYTMIAIALVVFAVRLVDEKIFTAIDFQEEIKRGNMAAALLLGAMLIFIGMVVSSGLKG